MMTILLESARLCKEYNGRPVWSNLTFQLAAGEKVGLIGRNGSGKSTLLKIIAGQERPTEGELHLYLPPEKVGYLPQEPVLPRGLSVQDYLSGKELPEKWVLQKHVEILGLGGIEAARGTEMLSGGEKSRLSLARLAAQQCELLLLDEPTTHLDARGLEWLEEYLQGFPGTALIVSHDRYLLDMIAGRILELERGSIRSYPGDYSAYARIKNEEKKAQWKAYREHRNRHRQLMAAVNRKKEWARRAAAASSPRTPYLAARAKKVDRTVKALRQRLDRLDEGSPRKPWEYRRLRLDFSGSEKTGRKIINAEGLGHSFNGRTLFENLTFTIFSGEAAVLIGPNGAGKTTLLRLSLGELKPAQGKVSLASSARPGYLGQEFDILDPELTVLETVAAAGETDGTAARHLLGALLFTGEHFHRKVATLSGGEKKRLILATLLARRVNLLILDEPTNHLDIESREAMEAAVGEFEGTILAVSHDRYFLHRLSDRVLHLEAGRLVNYPGSYGEYLDSLSQSGKGNPEEILLLENRLSYLSSRLNELAAPGGAGSPEEMEQVNREFIEISRKLQRLRADS
ncbi:MAG: ABC-F type ribosomal protection protein [Dethiobacteria bacterium]